MRASGVLSSLGIALAFFVLASGILMMRQEVVRYRPWASATRSARTSI